MANNTQIASSSDEEKGFSLKDFLLTCLASWKWFVLSVIVCVGLGAFYYIRQQPVYSRSMLVLIQDDQSNGGMSLGTAFKDFGFGGPSTNVYNEMVSMTSPAVMYEVVRRLQLNVSIVQEKFPHDKSLYRNNCPFEFVFPDMTPKSNMEFVMSLNPDDTFSLSEFAYTPEGETDKVSIDKTVKGKLGFAPVATPLGSFELRPNGLYTNNRDAEWKIRVKIVPEKSAVESYLLKVNADLENPDADVIELSISDVNTQRAENILETIVEVYNEFWVRDKNRMAVATAKFIDERLNSIVHELGEVDGEIADYQKEHGILDLDLNAKSSLDETRVVNQSYLETSTQLAMTKYIRDYLSNPGNINQVIPINSGTGSQVLEQQIAQYNTLILTMDNLKSNSSSTNPIVKDYERQTGGLRQSLLKTLNAQVGQLEANINNLNKALGQNKEQISSAPKEAQYLGAIKRDQAVKENLYLFLLERREENNLTQAFNAYNTRIINPPFGASAPISPKKFIILAVSLFLGILIPAGWLYIKVLTDTKIRVRTDLDNLPIPFTGEIPLVGKTNRFRNLFRSKKERMKIIDTPKPLVMEGKRDIPNEAFRVVRSNIDLMLGRNHSHSVLMVTSFNPGSGKSFIAYNLGASFALKRKKVLIIDADLRHGSMSTYVDNPSRGLAAYLSGNVTDISRITYPVEGFESFSIIPIGKRPPNPAELLEGDLFGKLIEEAREQYDIILVDCPPVNIVVDTQIINHYGDATLFVVRAGLFERAAVSDLVSLYNEHKLKRMSILLNGVAEGQSSYSVYGNYQSLEE